MHHPGLGRLPGKVVVLGHRQRVHVGAQADHSATAALAAMDQRHHTGLSDAGVNLVDPTDLERLDHPMGGVVLLKTDLRVSVQVAPQCSQLGMESSNVRKGSPLGTHARGVWHQWAPDRSTRKRGSTAKYSRSTTRLMTTKISAMRQR
jgi:hypothetical protein